jgi:hypothetical protein
VERDRDKKRQHKNRNDPVWWEGCVVAAGPRERWRGRERVVTWSLHTHTHTHTHAAQRAIHPQLESAKVKLLIDQLFDGS